MSLHTKNTLKLTTALAQMSGYFGGIASYDDSVSKKTRIRMLNHLIEMWSELDPESKLTQEWISRWKEEIQRLGS